MKWEMASNNPGFFLVLLCEIDGHFGFIFFFL